MNGRPRILDAECPAHVGTVLEHFRSSSRLDAKDGVITRLADRLLGDGLVDGDNQHWLMLTLEEAVTNAMLHGNEGDPSLSIECTLSRDADSWTLTVADEGMGFTGESIPDPDDPASLLLEHGRGILLMTQWLDDLTYWRGGRCARLHRRINAPPPGVG